MIEREHVTYRALYEGSEEATRKRLPYIPTWDGDRFTLAQVRENLGYLDSDSTKWQIQSQTTVTHKWVVA